MKLLLHDRVRFLGALFVLGAVLCLPLTWVWAQSRLDEQVARDSVRVENLEKRVESFSNLPTDVALLKAEVAQAGTLLWYVIGGGIAAIFAEIGHRLFSARKKSESEERLVKLIVERLKP